MSPHNYTGSMTNNDEVLVSSGGVMSNARVEAYANRLEVSYPRVATLGLTRRTETYPYRSVKEVSVRGGTLTLKLGTLSVRRFNVGRGKAREIAALIRAAM